MVTDVVQRHNYSYVPAHSTELKVERKKANIIRIYQHLVQIYAPVANLTDRSGHCSGHCYKSMTR
jgi:hypothetical protein